MPTLEETRRMTETAKAIEKEREMAAEAKVTPIKEDEDAPVQLAIFEGNPVHAYKASLTAAGWMNMDAELKVGSHVSIEAEGVVSKVIFHKKNGVTTRQHVIVVDAEATTIKPA